MKKTKNEIHQISNKFKNMTESLAKSNINNEFLNISLQNKELECQKFKNLNLENDKFIENYRQRYRDFIQKCEKLWEDLYSGLEELPDPQTLIDMNTRMQNLNKINKEMIQKNVKLEFQLQHFQEKTQNDQSEAFDRVNTVLDKMDMMNYQYAEKFTNEINRLESELCQMNERIIKIAKENNELHLINSKLEDTNLDLNSKIVNLTGQLTEKKNQKKGSDWKTEKTIKIVDDEHQLVESCLQSNFKYESQNNGMPNFIKPEFEGNQKNVQNEVKKDEMCFDCKALFQKRNRIKICAKCGRFFKRKLSRCLFWSWRK